MGPRVPTSPLPDVNNKVVISSSTTDSNVANNTYYQPTNVLPSGYYVVGIDVTKTANPTSVPEPGANVIFTVEIENASPYQTFDLLTVIDNVYGDVTSAIGNPAIVSTDFSDPGILQPSDGTAGSGPDYYSFTFEAPVTGNAGSSHTDTVTATGTSIGETVSDFDDATVTVTDVLPTIRLDKTASPATLAEPGGTFTYTYTVVNLSVEPVTLTKIVDDKLGTLYEWVAGMDVVTIPAGGSYLLPGSFTKAYTDAGAYPNKGEAWAKDNEGNAAYDDDSKSVTVTDVLPTIRLDKTASPATLAEPGGTFTYTYTVVNLSVEPVTLTKIVDDKLGTLYEWVAGMDVVTIPAGGSYLLPGSFTKAYTDAGAYPNKGEAWAKDNEGNATYDDDSKSVTVTDVLPDVALEKSGSPASIDEPGGLFHFMLTITNNGPEPFTITSLTDTNLLAPYPVTVAALIGQTVPAGESVSASYDIFHDDAGNYDNTAEVVVQDNEGNPDSDIATASVQVNDIPPTVTLEKLVDITLLPEPGGDFHFILRITNTSVESVLITALTDDNLPTEWFPEFVGVYWMAPGEVLDIPYTVNHSDAMTYGNIASVTVEDNEGTPASAEATQTVEVTDVLPTVTLDKSVDVPSLIEPGGTFNYTLYNHQHER